MSKLRYYALRSVKTVFLLWIVLTILFLAVRLMPGDFTDVMLGQGADPETVEEMQEEWGLNDPLYVQYFRYLYNFVTLDPGVSTQHFEPVWDYVNVRIFNTIILALPAITAAYIVGGILGSVIGDRRGSRLERIVITFVTILGSFPGFFTAIIMIVIFASWLDIFPTGGMLTGETYRAYQDDAWWRVYLTRDFAYHYTLPFITILLRVVFGPTLVMRTSTIEVSGQDFAYYQRVSGLPYVNRLRHLSRHAVLPLITLYPISMVQAVSGLVLVELVFNWPGIGWTLIEAVQNRDYPTVQFIFFTVAALVIIANFIIDILYGVIDPRVSVEES